jgi:hypothetical protein
MEKILAKRYAFCNFSSIVGFPNPVPSRDEWENSLPRFRGEEWEVPAEHLLDFHDFIDRLEIVHEDVQIKLFKFSLEGIALDWCQSLPSASVSSLADFHAAFHVFCEDHFPADLLYPQCCHEFHLLTKDSDVHEEYDVIGDISHCDQECVDAVIDTSHEYLDPNNREDLNPGFGSVVDDEGNLHLSDVQTQGNCSKYGEEGEKLKIPDQQSILHVCPARVEQSTFNIEISEGHQ